MVTMYVTAISIPLSFKKKIDTIFFYVIKEKIMVKIR